VLVVLLLVGGGVGFAVSRRQDVAQGPTTTVTSTPDTRVSATSPTTAADPTTQAPRSTTTQPSTTSSDEPTSTDPPTTAAPQWSTFTDPNGHYSIDFPGSPMLSTSSTEIDGNEVGIFDYSTEAHGVDYELAVAELPPGYVFTNPQLTLDRVVGAASDDANATVVARDDTPFANNPALYEDMKEGFVESQVFGLISGNRIYVMVTKGVDLSDADFPRFRSSFQIH
jgi:hypothetical protein